MSESEATEPEVSGTNDDPVHKTSEYDAKADRKRARHRKKQLFMRILKQMEFYFSDANLTKDRFLGELTQADPAVPLEVFLKFNKIRALTLNVNDIAKALRGSKLLECIDDNTKVRRVIPLKPYDAEARTVYVEAVPASVGRDWLEDVFSEYGPVAYISLPKFKNSDRIKGFAFIEFEKPEDTQKCLSAFTKMGCKLPVNINPEQLTTIKTFASEQPGEKQIDESSADETKAHTSLKDETVTKEDRKRLAERRTSGEPPKKKQKNAKKRKEKMNEEETGSDVSDNVQVKQKTEESVQGSDKSKVSKEQIKPIGVGNRDNEESVGASSQDDTAADAADKTRKCRKRTAKERNKSKKKVGKSGLPAGAVLGLQVLSKLEWRLLRNKYLNLQRKQMKELKNSLRMKGLYGPRADTQRRDCSRADEQKCGESALDRLRQPEGVFVRVELPAPCLDVRLTKRQVRSNMHVQHVDVKEGATEMVVRFDTPDAAQQYVSSGVYAACRVLTGEDSAAEWARAAEARGAGARRPRGRERLLVRAAAAGAGGAEHAALATSGVEPGAQHIRFDD